MSEKSGSASNSSGQAQPQRVEQPADPQDSQISQDNSKKDSFNAPPITVSGRVTKKPFGIFITPQNSPVQPERFRGYHTGTDFETFPEEQDIAVPIYAITDGKILLKKSASGYGGVLVEDGTYNNSPITIIYGHLSLNSIYKEVGDSLAKGEQVGVLGKGYSSETDGERKHLHLGIHIGKEINIWGYVPGKESLKSWIDPMVLLASSDS